MSHKKFACYNEPKINSKLEEVRLMNFTYQDIGVWIFRLFGAMFCCIMLYVYIEYRISLAREKRAEEAKLSATATPPTAIKEPASYSGEELLELLLKKGYCIALDVGVLSKYPQLMQVETSDTILITEEIANAKNRGKVVGIHQFTTSGEVLQPFKRLRVNDSFVAKVDLDPSNITDRAISAYLYTERTDLINVVFVTLDPEAQKRAIQVGLKAELV
jgi:hypothetical protein